MANNPKNQDEDEEKIHEGSKKKELICEGVYGKVKWFNVKRGYGFVCRNDNQEDVFIHQSAIAKSNPDHPRRSVGEGEEIYFDIVKGVKGNEAANVCGADGSHVKGSEYALRYQRGRFRGRGRGGRGRGRSRGPSEDADHIPPEMIRGGGGGGGGRNFRGGRPYVVQYRRPYPGYDMPPPPPPQFYYDYEYMPRPPRGRGGYRGGRVYRGGPPREIPMNFPSYDFEFMERRPWGGRGRPRFRGRGSGRGPRDGGRPGGVKDYGEEPPVDEEQQE